MVGAPGYPVSAALTFDIFAAPLLARLEGAVPADWPRAHARLARKLPSAMGVDDWIRVRLGRVRGEPATPLPRGARVPHLLVRADGLLVVPAARGHHAGEEVEIRLLRGVDEIERTIVITGSHDLVLDLAASAAWERDPGLTLASSNVGSLGGLMALRDGLLPSRGLTCWTPRRASTRSAVSSACCPATTRRWCGSRTGTRALSLRPATRWGWPGSRTSSGPGFAMNRQRGAGTRVLLDHELAQRDRARGGSRLRARGAHAPGGRRRGGGRPGDRPGRRRGARL